MRFLYVPRREPIVVRHLEPNVAYQAIRVDLVSGGEGRLGAAQPDSSGSWTCFPGAGEVPDWLLVLAAPT